MDKKTREVRNLAKHNKNNIMYKSIEFNINGDNYTSHIKGVGAKAIKLETFITYEDILQHHDTKYLEGILWSKINRVYKDTKSTNIGNRRVFY